MSSTISRERFGKYLDYKATFAGDPAFDQASFSDNAVATYMRETRGAEQVFLAGNTLAYQLPGKAPKVVDLSAKAADAWLVDLLSEFADETAAASEIAEVLV